MAADWIKMRSNLWDDPRVARICDLADSSEAAVIGGLYWLWAMADQHSSDGQLHGLSLRALDRKTGVPGLGAALVAVGWLLEDADGLTIPAFEEHNSASAKKRAQTAQRVAMHKSKNGTSGNASETPAQPQQDPDSLSSVTPPDECANAQVTHPALPREREREREREEIQETSSSSSVAGESACATVPDDDDDDDDGFLPKTPEAWARVFERRWQVRRKRSAEFGQLAVVWTACGLTVGDMAAVVAEALGRAGAGGVGWLPAYAERVRVSMAAEAGAAASAASTASGRAVCANPADVARQTVPGPSGPDPVLAQIEADRAKAVPPPPAIREAMAKMTASRRGASGFTDGAAGAELGVAHG